MYKTFHHLSRVGFTLILFVLAFALPATGSAQPASAEQRDRGVRLLESGNTVEAIEILRIATKKNKSDFVAWHWLAVALERQAKPGDARKAHEKAAKLGETWLFKQVSDIPMADFGALLSIIKPQIALAAESAAAFIKLSTGLSKSKARDWAERAEFLSDFGQVPQGSGVAIYRSSEVTTRARVLAKPEPTYTEEARKEQITGTVVLRAIFAEDGRVRSIIPLRRLPGGLTAQAIKAARRIQFTPATKDGRPVSMWMQLEYNFNLY